MLKLSMCALIVEGRKMDNCISEIAYEPIPQAVKDWIREIGWEREDVRSYHAKFPKKDDNLIEVTVTGEKGKRFALFVEVDDNNWLKVL